MLNILLLSYLITLIQAIIPCSDESSNAFVHVEIFGSDKAVVCHDDFGDLSQYSYKDQIYLDGQWHQLTITANMDVFNCHVGCKGCWGQSEQDCFSCSSLSRGDKPLFPTFEEFVSVTPYSCSCRENFIDDGTKDCKCPDGFYTKRSTVDDIISCEKCPITFAKCKYEGGVQVLTCATGIGRTTNTATQCACEQGYKEVQNQVDCILSCNKPCSTCEIGSDTSCTACVNPLMDLKNSECLCRQGYYLQIDGTDFNCLGISLIKKKLKKLKKLACHPTCLSCNGPDTTNCLSCDTLTLRILQNGQCQCPQFYATSEVPLCFRCDPSCLTCMDQDSCVTCISESNRYVQNAGDYCTCMPGFAEDPSLSACVNCHFTCSTCQDKYDTCTGCPLGSHRLLLDNDCICQDRYYESGQTLCEQCHFTCLTCSGSDSNNCLSCDPSKNRVSDDSSQCVCQYGYGYTDLNTELCQICNNFCLTCDIISNCLTCDQLQHRVLSEDDGKCNCASGYYLDNSSCIQCHYTCQTCMGSDFDSCLTCDQDQGRKIVTLLGKKSCPCAEGYFNTIQGECKQCYYACISCFNEFFNGCSSCDPSRALQNSQCLCPIQQIDDGYSKNCQSCHYSCLTCTGQENNNCITCYDNSLISTTVNRIYQYSECICPYRWYDNQVNENCEKCHKSCFTCFKDDEYSCISCLDDEHRILLSNSCLCQDGYFENLNLLICEKCEYRCLTCQIDTTNCLTCPIGSLRNIQQTINTQFQTCGCPSTAPRDIQDNPICQTCHFSCQNCSDQGDDKCTICDKNYNRYLSLEVGSYCKCLEGYYDTNVPECAACSPYCLGCASVQDNCTSCNANDFRELKGNQCFCGIRFGPQNLSYFDASEPLCQQCHYSCYTCNGDSYLQCLSCSADLDFRQLQNSQCTCIQGYLDNGVGICLKCDDACLTCAIQKSFCTSCPVGSLRIFNIQAQTCDCPSGYFDPGSANCQICHSSCDTCSDRANKCLTCKNASNRTYNGLLYTCDCLSGYYDLGNGMCSICHFSCTECSGSLEINCITCPDFLTTFRLFKLNSCVCQDKYFDDLQNKVCQPCSPTCYTCKDTQNTCLLCQNGQNRLLLGNECKCLVGYFESGNIICEICSINCEECQNNKNQCTKCSGNRILNAGTCVCKTGYYEDSMLQCQQCDQTCQTCQNSSTFCTTCDTNNFRVLSFNKCVCQQGLLDLGAPLCQACDTRCESCSISVNQCVTCDLSKNRILLGSLCQCKDGYYENNIFQCQQCGGSCQTCSGSSTYCLSCYSSLTLNQSNSCKCLDGTYIDSNNICQQCSYKCKTCETSPIKCLDCVLNRNLVQNSCLCMDGSYDSGVSQCQLCSYKCTTCSLNASNCLTCNPISNRQLQGSNCVCLQGFYDAGALICAQCHYSCLTCTTSQQNCTSCDISSNRAQTGNKCNCIQGYFDDGTQICQQCHYSCLSCALQATKCTSCDIGFTFRIDGSTNFSQCPCQKGFYDDGTKICKQCHYNCIDCSQTPTNCTICNNNPEFSRVNLTPSCACQDGYFDDGIQPICQKCDIKCLTCITNSKKCLICESPLTRNTIPLCDCKDGYYLNSQQKCSPCSIKCLTCVTNQYNCLTCQSDRITKQCLCQDGYYEANQLLCQECSPKCVTCENDKLNCLTCKLDRINPPNCVCKHHYYDDFINIECQECDQYCGSCDNNGCIDCAANRLQQAKTCICPANSVSYTDTPWCSTCSVAVVTGIFSDDLTTILYTFEYPLFFNFPRKVDIQAQCQQIITNKTIILLGQSPQCSIDNNTLLIELGDGSTVLVGDSIEFNPDLLKHKDCNQTLGQIFRTIINPPKILLKPSIKLNYPVQISPCQQIQISIISQEMNGKRNLQLQWLSSFSLNSIQLANQQQFQTLTIETGELPENSIIDIQLYFTNFLNQSDSVNINFTTLSSSTPQFNFLTTKTEYISWSPIKIIVYYSNKVCTGGVTSNLNNQITIDFSEIVENRTVNSTPIQFQETHFTMTDQEAMVSTIIPARTLSINSNYSILATFSDITNSKNLQQYLNILIQRSPLIVQIIGGTRIQNYLKSLQIKIQAKDPDLQQEWNQDQEIKLEVTCLDVQTNLPCMISNKTLKLNQTYTQELGPRIFNPFNVILFKVVASKGSMKSSDQASIIFLDAELPALNVSYPLGYNLREVNINEKLQFEALQTSNDIQYSYALVYNYEIVYITNVNNNLIKFAIWDNFNKFDFINTISARILAHDIHYLMPQVCSITLNVNMPPINSIINISPQYGSAFFTNFGIRVTNSRDEDSPIQYRFAYYQNQTLFDKDINQGTLDYLIILQDFSSLQSYSGLLESGDLIILVSVADSLGSTVNYTQTIKSIGFYESQQLSKDNSSMCQDFVEQMANKSFNYQEIIILTKEFIKLKQENITANCTTSINRILLKYQEQLFNTLLQSTNSLMQQKISNVLSQLYSLKISSNRILDQDQDMCFSTSSQFIQFKTLNSISNVKDSQQMINNIGMIGQQIDKSILQNIKLLSFYRSTLDIGDDQTYRNIQQNILQRKSFVSLLSGLYSQVFQQRQNIRNHINKILTSLQLNLDIDQQGIRMKQNHVGVYINKLSQQKYNSLIIPDQVDSELQDLTNYSITRFVQITKYPDNYNIENQTFQLEYNQTNDYEYIKTLILFEFPFYDPFIYVLQGNNVNRVEQIFQGRLNYNFDNSFAVCNNSEVMGKKNSNYSIVCSNFRDDEWRIDECQISQSIDKLGKVIFSCLCNYVNPVTLMVLNITNMTKAQNKEYQISKNIEFLSLNIENYLCGSIIILLFICLSIITILFKNYRVNLNEVKQRSEIQKINQNLSLTQQPHMSTAFYKKNLKYLHQLTRIFYVDYIHISTFTQMLLFILTVNSIFALLQIFQQLIDFYISVIMTFIGCLIFQIIVKILEGFFTGPKVLKIIGYIILITMNLGILFLNMTINNQNPFQIILISIGLIIIIFGPIEILIQYIKIKLAFQMFKDLEQNPLDPLLNFGYYFIQDEVLIFLIDGAQI